MKSSWLRAEAEAGRLPGLLAGDRWLFDLAALERALQDRMDETEVEKGDGS